MTLDELLRACRQHHIILRTNRRGQATLWAPNTSVPRAIRAAINEHREELARLIRFSDIRCCPNAGLHRPGWYRAGQQVYRCKVCSQLLAEIWSPVVSHSRKFEQKRAKMSS
jgi:hypothetical protein